MKELLIVDDDVAIRTALEVGFRRAGWITETASCVQEALFKFRNHVFPLVITDVKMPDGEVLLADRWYAPATAGSLRPCGLRAGSRERTDVAVHFRPFQCSRLVPLNAQTFLSDSALPPWRFLLTRVQAFPL